MRHGYFNQVQEPNPHPAPVASPGSISPCTLPACLPTHLHHGAAPQVIGHQRLVRLGQAQLPGQARRLDGRPLGGAGAAVVPADQHVVSVACSRE